MRGPDRVRAAEPGRGPQHRDQPVPVPRPQQHRRGPPDLRRPTPTHCPDPARGMITTTSSQVRPTIHDLAAALASPRSTLLVRPAVVTKGGPVLMLHVG